MDRLMAMRVFIRVVEAGSEIDKINEFEDIDCRHPQGREGLELAGLLE